MSIRTWCCLLFSILALCTAQSPRARASQTAATQAGVVTGTITDASGTPIVGARVQAVGRAKKWAGPYYEIPTGTPDQSDDRGQFRLHSLPPGHYVVAVSMPPAVRAKPATGYLRTYNPGTRELAEAQPIAVRAGVEHAVAISVSPVRLMDVSGLATTSTGEPAAGFDVWLRGGPATVGYTGVQGGFMTTMVATAQTGEDGAFSLSRVPPGAYTLMIANGRSRRGGALEIAELSIEVSDRSITGVTLRTARGATVSGQLEWTGRSTRPWPRPGTIGRLRATGVGRESDFASIDAEIQEDGTFRFTDLYGLRRIQALTLGRGWAIASVDAPKDVLAGPNLLVKPAVNLTGVKVIVTDRTGTLMTTVSDETGAPFQEGWMLLMPRDAADIDPLGWGYRATQRNRGSNGTWYYDMESILPGSYLAVAVDVEPYRLTGDAELMERARAAATSVEVREGRTPLSLRVVRLRQFVRDAARQ